MVFLQLVQRFDAGFLQHVLQYLWRLARADKHAVVLSHRGIEPQAVANHIGIGHWLQGLRRTYQHIATHHHSMYALWRHLHHLLVKRQLQTQQILRKALSALPTEHRHWRQDLTRWSIRRQTTTLSASMQQYALFAWQPLAERFAILNSHTGLQQPCGATTTTQLMSYRIVGTEVLITTQSCDIVETVHQIRWQREQLFHRLL